MSENDFLNACGDSIVRTLLSCAAARILSPGSCLGSLHLYNVCDDEFLAFGKPPLVVSSILASLKPSRFLICKGDNYECQDDCLNKRGKRSEEERATAFPCFLKSQRHLQLPVPASAGDILLPR